MIHPLDRYQRRIISEKKAEKRTRKGRRPASIKQETEDDAQDLGDHSSRDIRIEHLWLRNIIFIRHEEDSSWPGSVRGWIPGRIHRQEGGPDYQAPPNYTQRGVWNYKAWCITTLKRTNGRTVPIKSNDVRPEMLHAGRHLSAVLFIRVMQKNSTTSVITAQGLYVTYLLLWCLGTLIG